MKKCCAAKNSVRVAPDKDGFNFIVSVDGVELRVGYDDALVVAYELLRAYQEMEDLLIDPAWNLNGEVGNG